MKRFHEIRDPIHVFVKAETDERKVINSLPFQRLRYIHQLAMTYLVYPSATHRRFEHSLGVMELADRVFSVVTNPNNISHQQIRDLIPQPDDHQFSYWRKVLRMAALCHDMGHLPFSHAAESMLLPEGWDHEKLTIAIIRCDSLKSIWDEMKINPEDIAKLAVGPKKFKDKPLTPWETILSEIIVGDSFGVDRIDYLLRDSHHAGVAYGKFDHYRLIDCLRILPKTEEEPALGISEGGLHSAESLLLARYFMYSQLYFHPVRRIYDIHLCDFLKAWLPEGKFSTQLDHHISMTDNEVSSEIFKAASDSSNRAHEPARRIVNREHFRRIYEKNPEDLKINLSAAEILFEALKKAFEPGLLRFDHYSQKGSRLEFPVLTRDGRIVPSISLSETIEKIPLVSIQYIFVAPEIREKAEKWMKENRQKILENTKETE